MLTRTKSSLLVLLFALPVVTHALDRLELLPSDAQMYLRVSNSTNFWSELKQSPIGKLWDDPQFQDFIGNPEAKTWSGFFIKGKSEIENAVTLEQYKMLKGEVIMAFNEEMEEVALVCAMEETDFLKRLKLDDKLNDVLNESIDIVKSDFQGVEIIQHIPSGNENESSFRAFVDGTFLMGQSREWIERCIVRLQKEKVDEPIGNPFFNFNLPLEKLVEDWIDEMDGHGAASSTRSLVNALGLTGLKNFSMSIELKKGEMAIKNNLKVSNLTKGIFSLLDLQPSGIPDVSFVSESIASFGVGRVNLLALWKEVPEILASISPSAKLQLDMVIGMFMQQTGVDLEQDLLGKLDTQYLFYSQAEEGQLPINVIALELKDSQAFKTALESMLASPTLQMQLANMLEIEEFLDHTLYTVKTANPSDSVAFGVADNYLFYGQPEGLRQAIHSLVGERGGKDSFNRLPLVEGLRAHMPAHAFGFSAVNLKKYITIFIRKFRNSEFSDGFAQSWATSGVPLPPPNLEKLPSAEHIASFFNVSYQYVEASNDGLCQQIFLKYWKITE